MGSRWSIAVHSMLTNHLRAKMFQMTSGTHLSLAEAKTFFLEASWALNNKKTIWMSFSFLRSESDSCQRQIASATYDLRVAYSIKMGRWRLWAGFSDFDNLDRFHWCWSLCSWQRNGQKTQFWRENSNCKQTAKL